MLYQVTHSTTYEYADAVVQGQNLLHLEPRPHPRQRLLDCAFVIDPIPTVSRRHVDYFGNPVYYFSIQQPHRRLSIEAHSRVDLVAPSTYDVLRSPPWHEVPGILRSGANPAVRSAYGYTFDSAYVACDRGLADYAAPSFFGDRPLLEAVLDLTGRIYREFRYDARATTVATPLREVLMNRAGVCQDFAHLQIGCLRSLGLAARYVSGYLVQRRPDVEPVLVGADASHAWLSVFCPTSGWLDVDPTNDMIAGDRHITLAWGRDYDDVSPVRGIVIGGGESTLTVAVDVAPVSLPRESGPISS